MPLLMPSDQPSSIAIRPLLVFFLLEGTLPISKAYFNSIPIIINMQLSRRSAYFCMICWRAIAGYLNRDLPCKLSPDDVHLTAGCKQAIQVILTVLARPGANILLPKPGFPLYEANARHTHLEIRHFDLLPEKGWEVDLDGLEALADENTVAMVIVNPGNPCGNVFTYQHLQKVHKV